MSDKSKVYTLILTEDRATVVWWALYEKMHQMSSRVTQFSHMSWPAEAKNAARWEFSVINDVLEIMREEHQRVQEEEE